MSVLFAMVDDAPAFFLIEKSAPKGAVAITEKRHAELLEAQGDGRVIFADETGKPKIASRKVLIADQRAQLIALVKAEARQRIEAIAPLWRQLNDARHPTEDGALRFMRIDTIREASEAIEASITELSAAELAALDVANHPFWPEFD